MGRVLCSVDPHPAVPRRFGSSILFSDLARVLLARPLASHVRARTTGPKLTSLLGMDNMASDTCILLSVRFLTRVEAEVDN